MLIFGRVFQMQDYLLPNAFHLPDDGSFEREFGQLSQPGIRNADILDKLASHKECKLSCNGFNFR